MRLCARAAERKPSVCTTTAGNLLKACLMVENKYLHLHKRRYVCQCGKRFYEKYTFFAKHNRMTKDVYSFCRSD